jgi:hypothetical protein
MFGDTKVGLPMAARTLHAQQLKEKKKPRGGIS